MKKRKTETREQSLARRREEYRVKYIDVDPVVRRKHLERLRRRSKSIPPAVKAEYARRKFTKTQKEAYDLSPAERKKLLMEQDGGCAICLKADGTTRHSKLRTDHDHQTMQVRGLLCNNCNLGLGKLGDTLESLEKAVAYLRKARGISLS